LEFSVHCCKLVHVVKVLSNGYLVGRARVGCLTGLISSPERCFALSVPPLDFTRPSSCWRLRFLFACRGARILSVSRSSVLDRCITPAHTIRTSAVTGFAGSACGCCVDIFVVQAVPQIGGFFARFLRCPMQQLISRQLRYSGCGVWRPYQMKMLSAIDTKPAVTSHIPTSCQA
jgi:hypothetical protein